MNQPQHELSQIIQQYGKEFIREHPQPLFHLRTLHAIAQCRTMAMGGHVDACDACGHIRVSYNSCRNRHCPKCQSTQRERWIISREQDLLPVNYFHIVFTLPEPLNQLCIRYPEKMYNTLFHAAWETIRAFSADPKHLGAETGMISILHTWGQQLWLHPHLHCIVPGGGTNHQGKWKQAKGDGKFLFPVKAMSRVFRGKFMEKLRKWAKSENISLSRTLTDGLYQHSWVVYAKQPFWGPQQVVEYLGRYTHKIAISNHRLKSIENGNVTFTWKDYRDGEKRKVMTLRSTEFLRRFCLHILPAGFVRIRHYGFLSCRKKSFLQDLQRQLGASPSKPEKLSWQQICTLRLGYNVEICPICGKGTMVTIQRWLPGRSPPLIVQTVEKRDRRNKNQQD